MADGFVQVAPDNPAGKKIDNSELTVGANTVERQRINIADPTVAANIAGVTATGAVLTDASATTQPVSAVALPLPTGAATEATLAGRLKPADTLTKVATVDTITNPVAVTAAALPLPAGAATEATLAQRTKPADQQHTILDSGTLTGITNPVAVTAAALPLPAGAATDAGLVVIANDIAAQARLIDTQPVSEASLDAAIVAADGSTDPTKLVVVAGESNDATPLYGPMPLGPGARSVIIEGFGTGVPVPVTQAGNSATLDDVLVEMRAVRMGLELLLDQYGAGIRLLEVANAS